MNASEISSSDRELWRVAAAGDSGAREQLIDRALAVSRLRLRRFSAADQEELRQRIAMSVLRALVSGVAPQRNLDALLEWRVRAEITAFVRELIRGRRLSSIDAVLDAAGHDACPLAAVRLADVHRALRECIAKVPNEQHRRVVHARLIDQQELAVIAAGVDTEIGLVRVWLARATALVRRCVERSLRGKDAS